MVFGKVKNWFGIEGVKLELELPEEVNRKSGEIHGTIKFTSIRPKTVTAIRAKLVEKYKRGRRKNKLIDEYEIGYIEVEETFTIEPEEVLSVDFVLPFELMKSEMDQFQDKNFVFKGLGGLAKLTRGVKSDFRVEVEADVKGTRLSPGDEKGIKLV